MLWPAVYTWLNLLHCCTLNCKINFKTLTLEWWVRGFSQRQQAPVLWQALGLIYLLFLQKIHLHLSFSHSPGIHCCNWVPAVHVSEAVTGKGTSRYTKNVVSSPKYWVPLQTEWREKAIYGDCNLGYFHCSESGRFHKALGCFFSQAFEKEKELCLPPKEEVFIWAFYDSSWCLCALRWKGLRNVWGYFNSEYYLIQRCSDMDRDFHYFFLNRINF